MTIKERIFHAIIFEFIAILFLVGLATFVSEKSLPNLTGLAIFISTIAMVWNYIFNLLFDRFSTGERIKRSTKVRIVHSLAFELGLLIFTVPLIMWVLDVSLIKALIMDFGAVIFFVLYTYLFNLFYDSISHHFKVKNLNTSS